MHGTGASIQGARWNSLGIAPIYAAENYSAAFLEMMVRLGKIVVPPDYHYCSIEIPDGVAVEDSRFPVEDLDRESLTRRTGNTWWRESKTAVLRVPSAITRVGSNYLINPKHPDFPLLRPSDPQPVWVDPRMIAVAQGLRPTGR